LGIEEMIEKNRLEVTVYNIEVEDFHTYYVNGFIWVHNTACFAPRAENGTVSLPENIPYKASEKASVG
jgi:hypothetical protein